MRRTIAALAAAAAVVLGVAVMSQPGSARVAVAFALSGDTAVVTATWDARGGASGYLVEWTLGADTVRVVEDGTSSTLTVAQGEDAAAGSVCVRTLNAAGRPSPQPACLAFTVPPTIPLLDAPEGLRLEIETAPGIDWDSLRVAPRELGFTALGQSAVLYGYAYSSDVPWSCVTLVDGSRGWAEVGMIAEDGAPVFSDEFRFRVDSGCNLNWSTSEDAVVSVTPENIPNATLPAQSEA